MTELLNCTGLSKAYGKKRALDHVDLHLEPGKIIGLLGPNGSGKTTLMKLANGLLQPTEGSITIAGSVPGPATKEIVSYLPDAAWLPDWMRVEQLVEMFHDFYADFDPARAGEMLAKLELDPKAPLKTLSKGNKEKVQLILAMSRAAKLYLLDEPIGGVDPAARDYILHTILSNYSEDATVVISTHLIGDIEPVLDEAIFLKEGKIFAHRTVDEIRRRLGVPVSVVDGGGSGVRCAAHNAEVGGVANSQHLYGLAADLHSAASPAEMKAAAEEVLGHTGGIGLYGWGIHVDTRQGYARWKG